MVDSERNRGAEAGRNLDAINEIRKAEAALSSIRDFEAKAEYGQWKNWYHGDWFTGVPRTQEALKQYEEFLLMLKRRSRRRSAGRTGKVTITSFSTREIEQLISIDPRA
jgi:hypothetical protein